MLAELKNFDTETIGLQLNQLPQEPETDVAAVLGATKIYEINIESMNLWKQKQSVGRNLQNNFKQ